jgi:hypothetical protein
MRRLLLVLSLSVVALIAAVAIWTYLALGPSGRGGSARVPTAGPAHAAKRGQTLVQPINFSHKIHAGDNRIACLYCHIGADKTSVATIPAVQTCMGCHKMVAATKPEIGKLKQYWDDKRPVPWNKVYDLPDHVRFTHKRHVKAGIECRTCHGPVETMPHIVLQQDLTMGFCVRCHKQHLNDKHTPASLDCATCHK